ncbi:signal recognition particle-docking protein FtsY [Lapidilactobacillus luobeiensis]|uniref:signal recognition particle-docking protein FtsY n=1 Tax=Lapidilactobacillus luobeiensis TaxID=2950371 RepID=UPI0021C41A36|nr:signal recognition particle-docking protein FtsY [Lapidilactobacillus luobeiensis]
MGFFDRVKKAFGGEKKAETTVDPAQLDQAADQSLDQVPSAADQAGQNKPLRPDTDAATTGANEPVKEAAPVSTAAADQEQAADQDRQEETAATTGQSELTDTAITAQSESTAADKNDNNAMAAKASDALEETAPTSPAASAANTDQTVSDQITAVPAEPAANNETSAPDATAEKTDRTDQTEIAGDGATKVASSGSVAAYDQGLAKSRHGFAARLNQFLAGFRSVDEDFFEDLEEMLIEADVGFETAMTISDQLRDEVKLQNAKTKKQVGLTIVEKMVDLYGTEGAAEDNRLHYAPTEQRPTVFLFVGVNGAGKTTTVGKLAARLKASGQKVLLAAADTFRAGAIEQLATWARRVGVDCVTSAPGADPASVVFEAVQKAKAENYDILLVDTAGRLQNKVNLMNELAKIKRVIVRELPEAPQEVLLVLDASTGQNALSQAKQFKATTDVTGIVLTKLDGSSKGGIVIAIRNELHLPVKLVGLGEKMTDLADFDAEKFVYGLFKGLIDEA